MYATQVNETYTYKYWLVLHWSPPLDMEIAALKEVLPSWSLFEHLSLNSLIKSQRRSTCRVSGPATAMIWEATSSDVTELVTEFSALLSDILSGAFSAIFLFSQPLLQSYVSVVIALLIKWNWSENV